MSKDKAKTEGTDAPVEGKEKLVKIHREDYQTSKTATGNKSLNNGDEVANLIEGLENDELYEMAGKFLTFPVTVSKVKIPDVDGLEKAYSSLNVGMQRMNLGNRFRGQIAKIDVSNEKAIATAKKDDKPEPKTVAGIDKLTKIASPFVKARDKRIAEEAKIKAKAQAEAEKKAKADAKAEKAKAA